MKILCRAQAHGKEACRTAKAVLRTAKMPRTAKSLCRTAKKAARQRVWIRPWSGRPEPENAVLPILHARIPPNRPPHTRRRRRHLDHAAAARPHDHAAAAPSPGHLLQSSPTPSPPCAHAVQSSRAPAYVRFLVLILIPCIYMFLFKHCM
jgi:hypothetical protein